MTSNSPDFNSRMHQQLSFQLFLTIILVVQISSLLLFDDLVRQDDIFALAASIACIGALLCFRSRDRTTSSFLHEIFVWILIFSCKWTTHPVVRTNVLVILVSIVAWWKWNDDACPFYSEKVKRSTFSNLCVWSLVAMLLFDIEDYETNFPRRLVLTSLGYIFLAIMKRTAECVGSDKNNCQ